jgi:hypothetical protein
VETLARRGYRFIVPVAPRQTAQVAQAANADVTSVLPSPPGRPSTSARRLLTFTIVVVICVAALVAYGWSHVRGLRGRQAGG